jgi:glucokinase
MFACIDLGGTNIRGTWIDRDGNVGRVELSQRSRDLEGTKSALVRLVRSICEQAPSRVQGIGLASAGPLDHRERRYLKTSNMPELDYFRVGDFLEERFGMPVLMENDAQAAALGEVWKGGLAGENSGVVLTLGTGVGSGVIMDGDLWRGGHFTGPELGHIFLGRREDRHCGCGQTGCAEIWLNKTALVELFRERGYDIAELREMTGPVERREPAAEEAMRAYGERLGTYLSILQVVFGLPCVGLSGGLSSFVPSCLDSVWRTLQDAFEYRQWWLPRRIVSSPDPEMSALYGMGKAWKLAEAKGEVPKPSL